MNDSGDEGSSRYIHIGPRIRITEDRVVEVWRRFLIFGKTRRTCRAPAGVTQINAYYTSFFRTPCGNFREKDIGLSAEELACLLKVSRLDWRTADAIRQKPETRRFGPCYVDAERRQIVLEGSGLIYPFTSVELSPDGNLKNNPAKTIAVIPADDVFELKKLLETRNN